MAKQRIGHVIGASNGGHPHGLLVEQDGAAVQVTITGGADGKKRHASAVLSSADDVKALIAALERSIGIGV